MQSSEIKLSAGELQAIREHKYYMSQKRGTEVSIEEAIEDFVKTYEAAWRREKARRDSRDQIREIEKHKYFRSMEEGRDIGRAAAAEEWCEKYAPIWRVEREALEKNGFLQVSIRVENPAGIHLRPTSELAELALRFDADIYVHKPGMVYYNFKLNRKPYMNVRSILGMLSMGIALGDQIEFIATGIQAREALAAITRAVNEPAKLV